MFPDAYFVRLGRIKNNTYSRRAILVHVGIGYSRRQDNCSVIRYLVLSSFATVEDGFMKDFFKPSSSAFIRSPLITAYALD